MLDVFCWDHGYIVACSNCATAWRLRMSPCLARRSPGSGDAPGLDFNVQRVNHGVYVMLPRWLDDVVINERSLLGICSLHGLMVFMA
jgi:hypothetical protein